MATQGGPAQPVSVVTSGPVEGGAAIPVAVVTDGRAVVGGPAQRVVVVTSGPVQGGPARPIVAAPSGAVVQGGPAIRVYVVSGSLNPTPTYTDKVKALNPIAYWPLADVSGSVATDESGNGRNGTYSNVTLGVPGIGDGRTAARFNGTNAQVTIDVAGLLAAFPISAYTLSAWVQVAAVGVWTDGADRYPFSVRRDGNNHGYLVKAATNNKLNITTIAGATVSRVDPPNQTTTGWLHLAQTFDKAGNVMRAYLNGAQTGANQTGLGTWAGQPLTVRIGSVAGANFWSGQIAHVAIFPLLTPAQIATIGVP